MNKPLPPKPIVLYDHLPGILAIFPAILFAILGLLSLFQKSTLDKDQVGKLSAVVNEFQFSEAVKTDMVAKIAKAPFFNAHMLFWIGLTAMIIWYIAYRFNLPKSKFLLVFGLAGTFVGIPVVLEIAGVIRPFSWTSELLGRLEPSVNTGAWFTLSIVFWVMYLINLVYSWTHMKVRIDETGLTVYRLGGKGERFELIGLKTENEPLDYLELFLAGVGSLTLKTRMDKEIFSMKRVVGLYRIPWFPFIPGKLAQIQAILNYSDQAGGGGFSSAAERRDASDQSNGSEEDDDNFAGDSESKSEGPR